jgi:hypothetical protein
MSGCVTDNETLNDRAMCSIVIVAEPSSATRPAGRLDCNSDAMAGLDGSAWLGHLPETTSDTIYIFINLDVAYLQPVTINPCPQSKGCNLPVSLINEAQELIRGKSGVF